MQARSETWRISVSVSCALASGDLGAEGIEALAPEGPEVVEPGVDLAEGCGIEAVDPPGAVGAHGREAVVSQHP